MTYKEHLDYCKKRALEYVDKGDYRQAFTSMASDMSKHPETANHPALGLGTDLLFAGHLDHPIKMREFIEGFN